MNNIGRMLAPLLMAAAVPALALSTVSLTAAAAEPKYQLGFEQAAIPDPEHAPIAAIVWYPTLAEARDVQVGPVSIKAALGAPVARSGLPMIILSHGTGAGAISHIDTAIALAEAGFIVVTPTHNGDNYEDDSNVGKPAWFVDRSRHIVRTVDFMLGSWRGATNVDKDRVGIFGFSAGATTALIAIGGEPDLGRLAQHCAKAPEFACRLFPAPDAAVDTPPWPHDPRIAAAAIAAPGLGFLFGPDSLVKVTAPVQIWAASDDEIVPYASNTANVRSLLPKTTEFHDAKDAGHLSFLAPCPDPGAILAICTDKPGFDRTAFHAELNAALIAFFRAKLAAPAGAAPEATPPPFENGLRRTIAIAGAEDQRFSLAERMAHYRVPGLSVAVIENCRIVDARGFGETIWSGTPITPDTRFQAGSISKSVTALGALRLLERGTLTLDADVRPQAKSWHYDGAKGTVTLRQLLSHTAGTNLEGMKGYLPGAALPTIDQILAGGAPANTPAIVVESAPGTRWSYSGGGYIVTQALMIDATGQSFAPLMKDLILRPLGMTASSFDQPPTRAESHRSAQGTSADGSPLPGKWRVYPEMAAAGLWTTPSDLGRFAIGLARSVRDDPGAIVGKEATTQLMARGPGNWGLGVDLGPADGPRQISHTGRSVGFTSMFVLYPDSCQGAVVMTNGYDGGWLINEVMRAIGDVYRWPARKQPTAKAALPLSGQIVERFVGIYRLKDFPTERFSITHSAQGELIWAREGHVGRTLLPEAEGRLFSPDSVMTIEALNTGETRASVVKLSFGGGSNLAERID